MGMHVSYAFASAIFLYLSLGYIRPMIMGNFSEAPPFGIITHLNWTRDDLGPLRQLVLQPVPHALDRVPLRIHDAVRHARLDDPGGREIRRRARGQKKFVDRGTAGRPSGRASSGAGPWLQRHLRVDPPLGLVVCDPDDADGRHRRAADRHRRRQLVPVGRQARHRPPVSARLPPRSRSRPEAFKDGVK